MGTELKVLIAIGILSLLLIEGYVIYNLIFPRNRRLKKYIKQLQNTMKGNNNE